MNFEWRKVRKELLKVYKCKRCLPNFCCKIARVFLNDNDILRISDHLKILKAEFSKRYAKISRPAQDHLPPSLSFLTPCPFHREDCDCSIYKVRPLACNNFPFSDEGTLFLAPFCPLSREIAKDLDKIDAEVEYRSCQLYYEVDGVPNPHGNLVGYSIHTKISHMRRLLLWKKTNPKN